MSRVGLIGLGPMGRNLALNLVDHGYEVTTFNRTTAVAAQFLADSGVPFEASLAGLVEALETPRVIILMVKAGGAVDAVLADLKPMLDSGDIVIDGGNSNYGDTARRVADLPFLFLGVGISGGEEGARYGPSIMPGGNPSAWTAVQEMLQSIAAIAPDGTPCCDWVGPGGAGHFVKTVHNGIEYGDMQVIAEAYDLMRRGLGMGYDDMANTLQIWNSGVLDSFLIDITATILRQLDSDGEPLAEKILDAAAEKGTGRWTVASSLDFSVPTTLISEAVFARMVSSKVEARNAAAGLLEGPTGTPLIDMDDLRDAMYASKIVSYAQGFMLLRAASDENEWDLDLGRVASLWRAGCIIRAAFIEDITAAFGGGEDVLMLAPFFVSALREAGPGWRRTVAAATEAGIPVPAFSSALAFYDSFRSDRLPANLIQAQRDLFGAHTYERIDHPRGTPFHTNWG